MTRPRSRKTWRFPQDREEHGSPNTWESANPAQAFPGQWNFRNENRYGWHDGTRWINFATSPGAWTMPIADGTGSLSLDWLEPGPSAGFIRSPVAAPNEAEWRAAGTNSILSRGGALSEVDAFALNANSVLGRNSTSDLRLFTAGAANRWFGRSSSGLPNLSFLNMKRLVDALIQDTAIAGTSFPSTAGAPQTGWAFYRTDLEALFCYSANADDEGGKWLGVAEEAVQGNDSINVAGYLRWGQKNLDRYSATVGVVFGFDVQPILGRAYVDGTSTCTFIIRDDGTDVSNTGLSYTAESGGKTINWLTSGSVPVVIPAGSVISLAVTSGTAITQCFFQVKFRAAL